MTVNEIDMQFRDPQEAFEQAIREGRLTQAAAEAGLWMYIGTLAGRDQFKNVESRQYAE